MMTARILFKLLSVVALAGVSAGCAGGARQAAGIRVDVARLRFIQGYSSLAAGMPDSAARDFRDGLEVARHARTPDETGRWGLALAERLRGNIAASDSIVLKLPPATQPESFFAHGWLSEMERDTLDALDKYRRAIHADTSWYPPYARSARLRAAGGQLREALELLDRAAALGDTLAPALRAALVPPPPLTPEEQLSRDAEASPALTRIQLAGLLRRHGQVRCVPRYPDPQLVHFRAARDSLQDMAGTPFVWLARDAAILSRMELFPDGTFRPDDVITRARFAAWLDGFDCNRSSRESPLPPDIAPGDYRAGAIRRALGSGLLQSRAGGFFAAEEAITGSEALEALRRILEGS